MSEGCVIIIAAVEQDHAYHGKSAVSIDKVAPALQESLRIIRLYVVSIRSAHDTQFIIFTRLQSRNWRSHEKRKDIYRNGHGCKISQ